LAPKQPHASSLFVPQTHQVEAKHKTTKYSGSAMESDANTLSSSPTFSHSSNTLSSSSPPQLVMTPCAACKILRRRCAEKCVLAPYFPPTEPAKFTTAHRVFGASNIIKFLQVNKWILTLTQLVNFDFQHIYTKTYTYLIDNG